MTQLEIEVLEEAWLKAYHAVPLSRMVDEMDEFLHRRLLEPFRISRHWVYLESQIIRLKREREESIYYFPTELPGMVYGMFCNAWWELVKELKDAAANNNNPNR